MKKLIKYEYIMTMEKEKLQNILKDHELWIESEGEEAKTPDLRWANLSGINLERANLRGANLLGAYLEDANLSAVNLEKANLLNALYNDKTVWPAGFNKI
jgi:uncharacterized protein YjbI with pentapeptide repeats